MDFNTGRSFIVSLFLDLYEDLIKALYFGPLLEKKMSAATDRNEQHRWSYMTHAQLLRRLATMTNKEKIQSFIEQASSADNPRLFEAGCDRMVETHGVCNREPPFVSGFQSRRPLGLLRPPQTIDIPMDLGRQTRQNANKMIADRIKRKTRAKSKPMRRKIRV